MCENINKFAQEIAYGWVGEGLYAGGLQFKHSGNLYTERIILIKICKFSLTENLHSIYHPIAF